MKKTMKKFTVAVVVMLAFLGLGGLAAYAGGYIQWAGTNDFNDAMDNLSLISNKALENKSSAKYWEDKHNHKQAEYENRLEVIEVLEKEIEELKNNQQVDSDELDQAEKDMKEVREETEKVLSELE